MQAVEIDADRDLVILTCQDLHNLSGVDHDDSDWVRDQKVSAYLHNKRWRVIDLSATPQDIKQAKADNLDILITKEPK